MTGTLKEAEISALEMLSAGVLVVFAECGSKTECDYLGRLIPGKRIWGSLIKRGYVLDPDVSTMVLEDGEVFEFTSYLELTDDGHEALRKTRQTLG